MSNEFEITADRPCPAEVFPIWADATERTAWEVQIPYVGRVWSYDKGELARWLRDAAEAVQAAPNHGADAPAFHWDGLWHAQCACGRTFTDHDQMEARRLRADHVTVMEAALTAAPGGGQLWERR
jgi:hypothetical protein